MEQTEQTTAEWIAERNAKLGQINEFDERGAAHPDPEGFQFEPQPEHQDEMADPFYERYVLGKK